MSIQNNVQRTFLIARSFIRFQNFKNCVYLPNKKKILIWACFTCSTFSLKTSNSFSLLTIIFGPFRKRFFGHRKRYQGRIQDFNLGGAHLKKLRRAEGGANFFGVFRVKNHGFTPKNHIFSNFRGARAAPPMDPPLKSGHVWCVLVVSALSLSTIFLSYCKYLTIKYA